MYPHLIFFGNTTSNKITNPNTNPMYAERDWLKSKTTLLNPNKTKLKNKQDRMMKEGMFSLIFLDLMTIQNNTTIQKGMIQVSAPPTSLG